MTAPIVTVTLNPAIDRTVWVDELVPGTTHRTADTTATFGGKGINVARVAARLGAPVVALGLAGTDQADAMERHLHGLGVASHFIQVPGETRTNLKILEQATGRLTEINGSGPQVSPETVEAFEEELLGEVGRVNASTVVLAGSLPLGVPSSVYAQWTGDLRRRWPDIHVLVDASDEPLELAVRAAPFFVKPNRVEAAALTGGLIDTTEHAAEAASRIAADGPTSVLLSLGPEGAVAAWRGQVEVIASRPIEAPVGQLRTTVGAGDAMVARVAVELAHRDGAVLDADEFFAIAHQAVREAEEQITGVMPMTQR